MTLENQNMSERKLMTFQWEGNSYGIMLEKLKSAQNNTVSQKKYILSLRSLEFQEILIA